MEFCLHLHYCVQRQAVVGVKEALQICSTLAENHQEAMVGYNRRNDV